MGCNHTLNNFLVVFCIFFTVGALVYEVGVLKDEYV